MARLSFNEFSAGQPIQRVQANVAQPKEEFKLGDVFNVQAAKDVFSQTANDINLAKQDTSDPFKGTKTAILQGGLSIPRAVGAGIFGTETIKGATENVIDQMVKFGDAITPERVQEYVGDKALKTIEGYNQMTPQEQLDQRNKLAAAEVLSYFVGGKAAESGATTAAGVLSTGVQASKNVASQVGKEVSGMVSDVSKGLPSISKTPTTRIVGEMTPEVKKVVQDEFTRAIKPNFSGQKTPVMQNRYNDSINRTVESIVNNQNNISFIDEATGEAVSRLPQTLKEFSDALDQTKAAIYKQYNDIAEQAGESGATVDMRRIANSLDEVINSKSLKVSNPESIAYAQDVRGRLLRTGELSAADVQDVIKNYNNSLDSFYRNPTPEGLTRNAVDALIANNLRRSLDEQIEGLTGAQYQALKNEYAALKTVERDVMRAQLRDARKNVKGLIDFTDVLSGGQVVSGILSFNPAMVAQGVAQKAVSGAIKAINDPNRAVKKIFERAGQYERPAEGFRPPSRKQLPPAPEGAYRSSVESGRTIQQPVPEKILGTAEKARTGAIKTPTGEGAPLRRGMFPTLSDAEIQQLNTSAFRKTLENAGVSAENVKKAIIAGVGSYLLMTYMGEDGTFLPAGLAILSVMPNKAKLAALDDALKINAEKRALVKDGTSAAKNLDKANKELVRLKQKESNKGS